MMKNVVRCPIAIKGTVLVLLGLLLSSKFVLKVQAQTAKLTYLASEVNDSIDISTDQNREPLTPNPNSTILDVLYPADTASSQVLTISESDTPFGTALSVVDRISLPIPTSGGFYLGKDFHSYADPCKDGKGNVRQLVGIWSRKFIQFNTIMDPPGQCVNSTGSPGEYVDIIIDGKIYPLTVLKIRGENGESRFYPGLYPISVSLLEALQNNSAITKVEVRFSDLGDGDESRITVRVNPASVQAFQQIYGTSSKRGE